MGEDEKKSAGIYRVETVPPPAGESDAYNAPTKVGPMPAATIAAMMQAAEKKVAEVNERAVEKSGRPKPIPREEPEPVATAQAIPPPAPAPLPSLDVPLEMPRLYEDVEDDDKATLVGASAKPPSPASAEVAFLDESRRPVVAPAPPAAQPQSAAVTPAKKNAPPWTGDALLILIILLSAAAAIYYLTRHH
jgi:hypothetical protein